MSCSSKGKARNSAGGGRVAVVVSAWVCRFGLVLSLLCLPSYVAIQPQPPRRATALGMRTPETLPRGGDQRVNEGG